MLVHTLERDGQDHIGGDEDDEDLHQMVRDFVEMQQEPPAVNCHHRRRRSPAITLQEIMRESMSNSEAAILEKIIIYSRDTGTAACGGAGVNQWIVEKLKEDGYQASLCKTSWLTTISSSSQDDIEFTSGYEFIDVMMNSDGFKESSDGRGMRVIIDMDFSSQFHVARPSRRYLNFTYNLPSVFVGSEEKLKTTVSLLCSAAKRSLRESGLHVPPWRKHSYVHNKYFSNNFKRVSQTIH